jgi:hypothetical protein
MQGSAPSTSYFPDGVDPRTAPSPADNYKSRTLSQDSVTTQDAIRDAQIPIADRDPTSDAAALQSPHQMVQKNSYNQVTAPRSTANGRGTNPEGFIREAEIRFPASSLFSRIGIKSLLSTLRRQGRRT